MQRRDLNANDAPPPVAAYTQAIEVTGATRTLYISGQVGQRMDGSIPDDVVEQSRLAWQNLEAQLNAAGMTLDNLVKITTILPNRGDLIAAREARSAVMGDRRPASTLIVGGLCQSGLEDRGRGHCGGVRASPHRFISGAPAPTLSIAVAVAVVVAMRSG
jgi:2-iminobutanoate/2-iminopropanoate deaminase